MIFGFSIQFAIIWYGIFLDFWMPFSVVIAMDFEQIFLLISDKHTKWHPKTPGMNGFEKKVP